ncbi:hypothetical protein GCM10011581_03700 [Saccharopolyspora subtropica]|uniref:Uncharacterized protein n=1 Tax=Saccharopolyspora thermophila TaxID=89367 RepID=A0A917N696_9PSEU|nr:hypothetical protein [Saccharopolyspora subtropica]GGI69938.1 hypothetical protein GCM10011581_03700 [Saccharopolyspora subtropica]
MAPLPPPADQPPATRIQQRLDAHDEPVPYRESGTLRDPDPYPDDHYRDPYRDDPYDDRRYRDDRYGDRYRDDHDDRPYREPGWGRYRDRDPYPDRDRHERRFGDRFHGPSADTIGRLIQVFTALISLVFVLHIIFVVTGANQENGFVSFTYGTARFFVFGLGDVFTPADATIGVVLNYGLAAAIYLFAGRIIARAMKR